MRVWSVHPSYLDTKGLLAVWREGLLALHVLQGKTKGYTQHPQLIRFKNQPQPVAAISEYLHHIVDEADSRGFRFKREKLLERVNIGQIEVTDGQLRYETAHLLKKLQQRSPQIFELYKNESVFKPHPLFRVVSGDIEKWEKIVDAS